MGIKGWNLGRTYRVQSPDGGYTFAQALLGTGTLLLEVLDPAGGLVAGGGFLVDTYLSTWNWYDTYLAYNQLNNTGATYFDCNTGAHWGTANVSSLAADGAVDASLSSEMFWLVNSTVTIPNSLTLIATLNYDYVDVNGQKTPCTPLYTWVELDMHPDNDNSRATAQVITSGTNINRDIIGWYDASDFYNISASAGDLIAVNAQGYNISSQDVVPTFYIYMYDPAGHTINYTSSYNTHQFLECVANSTGNWTIEIREGYYNEGGYYYLNATVDPHPNIPTLFGPSSGYAGASYTFYANTTSPENNSLTYALKWGDGNITTIGPYASGANASASYTWNSSGNYNVTVEANDTLGACSGWYVYQLITISFLYLTVSTSGSGSTNATETNQPYSYGQTVTAMATATNGWTLAEWIIDYYNYNFSNPLQITMTANHNVTAYFTQNSGSGGGCPFVSTWNGSQYVLEDNLLAASMFSGGADVNDSYVLQQALKQNQNGTYSLLLSEFENECDFIDQVQLFAVDHASNVNVGVSPTGQILTYANPYPPVSAITDTHENVRQLLSAIDGSYYEAHNGSYVILNFGDLDVSQGAKLVLRMDAHKDPVYIQVQDSRGQWNSVAEVIPRVNWTTDIIDMSKFLPDARGNLKVRLCFTADLKVDFVGLDTTSQARVSIREGQLVSAISSASGDVTSALLHADQTYAELAPGVSIQLQFTLPRQTMETRTYIIFVRGHYYTITP